ncbi:hypothetical protein P2318_13825 [Myxococcaceae bacterium GXIMD 01537]
MSVLGDLWLTPLCIMSRRLHEVLVQAGVDNLAVYPATLKDPVTGPSMTTSSPSTSWASGPGQTRVEPCSFA